MTGTIVDMHLHTVNGASDSALTSEQLLAEAHRIGLTGVNITEHDRLQKRGRTADLNDEELAGLVEYLRSL